MSERGEITFETINAKVESMSETVDEMTKKVNEHKEEKNICPDAPDGKHRYKSAGAQHAVMNHHCYECAYCGKPKCVRIPPPELHPQTLPTDEDLDKEYPR